MRKGTLLWIVIALALGTAIFWFTSSKKKILRNAVEKTVQKKTDSLYRITYDTSEIDEVSGDAYLKNVRISIDSARWARLAAKDSAPGLTLSLRIAKITVRGLKELRLLTGHALDVSAVIIDHPSLRLDKWKAPDGKKEVSNDTAELYKRLTGQFDFLRAKLISVKGGNLLVVNHAAADSLTISGINADVDHFLVDSVHDYHNVISYFVKQAKASVDSVRGTRFRLGMLAYDSHLHTVSVSAIATAADTRSPLAIGSVHLNGFSSEAFVYSGRLHTRSLVISDVHASIPARSKKRAPGIPLPAALNGISVDSVILHNGNFMFFSPTKLSFALNNTELLLKNVRADSGVFHIERYLIPEACSFTAGLMRFPVKFHNIDLKKISFPFKGNRARVGEAVVQPTMTRSEMKRRLGVQKEQYTARAENVIVEKLDIPKLVTQNTISMDRVHLGLQFSVFSDKTLPKDSLHKQTGRFFYEDLLEKLKSKLYVREIDLENTTIAYEEIARKSGETAKIVFSGIEGTIRNVTTVPEKLAADNIMKLSVHANVLGMVKLVTDWNLALHTADGKFSVTGNTGPFDAATVNQASVPFGMTRLKSGKVNRLAFDIQGDHSATSGNVLMDYDNLKIEFLKKQDDGEEKKKVIKSIFANADIRNSNHSGKTHPFRLQKEGKQTFFSLLWKSVFEGVKKNILIIR